MSAHQFYEFRAIDRALGEKEMRTLRAHSTRARITSTSFVNDYSWSDFRGNDDGWMQRYFDAFLYLASWGRRALKLRVPMAALDLVEARQYVVGRSLSMRERGGYAVVAFHVEAGAGADDKGEGKLSPLIPVRSALIRGDGRSLYLGWLLGVQTGEVEGTAVEPTVPVGLGQLDPAHQRLVELLQLDQDLVNAAAKASRPIEEVTPPPVDVRAWIAEMAVREKDELLEQLLVSDDPAMPIRVVQRLRRERGGMSDADSGPRTAAELLERGREGADMRRRVQAELDARENARREREEAAARSRRLAELAGNEPVVWSEVESLIATRQSKSYDHAVALLLDLRDLAAQRADAAFTARLQALYALNLGKPSLIDRMQRAGL
jgi:hypothetical protein